MSTTSISEKDRVDTILLGRPVNQKPIDALAIRNGALAENGSAAANEMVLTLPAADTGEAVFTLQHNNENIQVTLRQTSASTTSTELTTETQTVTWKLSAALNPKDRAVGVGIRSRPVNQKPIDALVLLPQPPDASVNGNGSFESVIRFVPNTQDRIEIDWTNGNASKRHVIMAWRKGETGGCEGVFQIITESKNSPPE